MPEPLPQHVLNSLRDIGLDNPDPADPLHVKLVATLRRLAGHSEGARLVALKFDFNWALNEAGALYAAAKVAHEHYIDRETVKMRVKATAAGEKLSRIEAEQIARSTDEAFQLYLKRELAEKREQSMRKFLDTLSSALDNHRTDRADQRQADTFQARGGVGESR